MAEGPGIAYPSDAMRRLLPLACLALLVPTSSALAQTTTVTKNAALVSITHSDGTLVTTTVNNQWYVNRRDCGLDPYDPANDLPTNVFLNVNTSRISTVDFGSNPLIYIGTSCNTGTNRSGSSTAPCVQAYGNATTSPIYRNGTSYTIPLESLRPISTVTNASNYDLCTSTRNSSLDIYIMPESTGSSDASVYALLTIYGDMSSPVSPTITTTNPQGDNSVAVDWSTASTYEVLGEVRYFALPGGCGTSSSDGGTDAGASDAGTDAGTSDGGTSAIGTTLTAGLLPPLLDPSIHIGSAGSTGTATIRNSDIGLLAAGETAQLGMAMRDAAGNYSVISNVVCVQRITTYGLCDISGGNCPQGGCAVSRGDDPAASLGTLAVALVTIAWLVIRRGGRS